MLTNNGERNHTVFPAFSRFVVHSAFEDYKQFCELVDGTEKNGESNEHDSYNEEYDRLRSAVINLFRREKLDSAALSSKEFTDKQASYEKHISDILHESVRVFAAQFTAFDEDEAPQHKTCGYSSIRFVSELNNYTRTSDEEYQKEFMSKLNHYLVEGIKKNMRLTESTRADATVATFFSQLGRLDADLIIGFERFRHNDPEYRKYEEFEQKCKLIEAYGANVHGAIDSRLIKVSVRSATVEVRHLNEREIFDRVSKRNVMNYNNFEIPLSDKQVEEYLYNDCRVVDIRFEVAYKSVKKRIGGGLLFNQQQKTLPTR